MSLRRRPERPRPRRSGPPDEACWWVPADQDRAEAAALSRRDFPAKGWRARPLVNNQELVEPWADVPVAAGLVALAVGRGRTALDEGRAFAGPDLALAVSRIELFADADGGELARHHRAHWQAGGPGLLAGLYAARWRERDVTPGWIECTWADPDPGRDPRIDWLQVEDHTDKRDEAGLFCYEHLQLWAGRALATITLRHAPGPDSEELAGSLAARTLARLVGDDRP